MRALHSSSLGTSVHASLARVLSCLQSVNQSSQVLSFGNGGQGALGLGDTAHSYSPEEVQRLPETIGGIAAGHYHSLAWDMHKGRLYTWGRNAEKQLGRSIDETGAANVDSSPGFVTGLPARVVGAAASGVASFAVDATGCVWSWGTSKRGQLGQGAGIAESPLPGRVHGLEGVASVACGWGHALALTEDGEVYAWGFPADGRLGGSLDGGSSQATEQEILGACVWAPQKVDMLRGVKVQQVSCSLDSSLVLTAADQGSRVLTFGDNSLGQLGRRKQQHSACSAEDWVVCEATGKPLRARGIAAGLSHNLAVLTSGQVAIWGWQHGLKGLPETLLTPSTVQGLRLQLQGQSPLREPDARVHVAAGRVHSLIAAPAEMLSFWDNPQDPCSSSWSLTEEGWQGDALLSWGSGQNGRLGLGSSQSVDEPEVVPELDGYQILDMACGHDHSLILVAKI